LGKQIADTPETRAPTRSPSS